MQTEAKCPLGERSVRRTLICVESPGHDGSAERGAHQIPDNGNGSDGGD
jgi:hypothetical protein